MRPLLLAALSLAGCTTVHVSYLPEPGAAGKGSMTLKAVRGEDPETLYNGYSFHVQRGGRYSEAHYSSSGGATEIAELDAGFYQVVITGRRINPIKVDLEVRPGERTVVTLYVRNARRASTTEDAVEVTGQVFLYTAFSVVYVAILVAEAWLTGEDDDEECLWCHHKRCQCEQMRRKQPPARGPVKDYLKK